MVSFDASAVRALGGELAILVDEVEQSLIEHRPVAAGVAEQLHELTTAAEKLFTDASVPID